MVWYDLKILLIKEAFHYVNTGDGASDMR